MPAVVPRLDRGLSVGPAEHRQRGRVEADPGREVERESSASGRRSSEGCARARRPARPVLRAGPGDDLVGARGDLLQGLPLGHAVAPDEPARAHRLDLGRGHALVRAGDFHSISLSQVVARSPKPASSHVSRARASGLVRASTPRARRRAPGAVAPPAPWRRVGPLPGAGCRSCRCACRTVTSSFWPCRASRMRGAVVEEAFPVRVEDVRDEEGDADLESSVVPSCSPTSGNPAGDLCVFDDQGAPP